MTRLVAFLLIVFAAYVMGCLIVDHGCPTDSNCEALESLGWWTLKASIVG